MIRTVVSKKENTVHKIQVCSYSFQYLPIHTWVVGGEGQGGENTYLAWTTAKLL